MTHSLELSIIIPTYNERGNVRPMIEKLEALFTPGSFEIVYVDDNSPDGTADTVRQIGREKPHVRCVQRVGRRGLSSAAIEGFLSSSAPLVAVIDGDLQHDETILPKMQAALEDPATDIAVGSRFVDGGGIGDWDEKRAGISSFATGVAEKMLGAHLNDPMSGFFMLRRSLVMEVLPSLSSVGFKILLDIIASMDRKPVIREVPYTFRLRTEGESKLDNRAAWDFGMLLLDKVIGRFIPIRLVAFSMVGGVGVLVHFAVLTLLLKGIETDFLAAQIAATLVAMTGNYILNNELTYRDRKLKGWKFLGGWVSFTIACSVGAVSNVGVATYLHEGDTAWALSALAGILVGTVWNYGVTAFTTWKDS